MNILDDLTYRDLAGKRRLRNYVKAALAIVAALFILYVAILFWVKMDRAAAVPPLLVIPTRTPAFVALHRTQDGVTRTPAPTATPEACPSDPTSWKMLDVLPGDNYKRIEPACVYDGLGRTVAWALAVNMGYTGAEAAQALGFENIPQARIAEVNILTNSEGPLSVPVVVRPPHPDYASWRFDRNKKPYTVFGLHGCFRTATIVGNRVEQWGDGYPVICVATQDYVSNASYTFSSLGEHNYATTEGKPIHHRYFAFFGYSGTTNASLGGEWTWLGRWRDLSEDIYPAGVSDEYKLFSELFGAPLWNAEWLEQTYGLSMRPLPENWQSFTNDADVQAVLDAINSYSP